MAKSENSAIVFNYLKEHEGQNLTAKDIEADLQIGIRSVNGVITALNRHKGLVERVEKTIENEEGKKEIVKFIVLTDAGKALASLDDYVKPDAE